MLQGPWEIGTVNLLMGILNGTAAVKNNLVVPQEVKQNFCMTQQSHCEVVTQSSENRWHTQACVLTPLRTPTGQGWDWLRVSGVPGRQMWLSEPPGGALWCWVCGENKCKSPGRKEQGMDRPGCAELGNCSQEEEPAPPNKAIFLLSQPVRDRIC